MKLSRCSLFRYNAVCEISRIQVKWPSFLNFSQKIISYPETISIYTQKHFFVSGIDLTFNNSNRKQYPNDFNSAELQHYKMPPDILDEAVSVVKINESSKKASRLSIKYE